MPVNTRTRNLCSIAVVLIVCACCALTRAQITVAPLKPSAIYDTGDRVGWTLTAQPAGSAGTCSFVIRQDNVKPIKSGEIDLSTGTATIETTINEPAMLYLEVTPANRSDEKSKSIVAAAAISPTNLTPVAARPDDFDAFWKSKLKELRAIAPNPKLTSKDSGDANLDYATIEMAHVSNTHVYGQFAKPKGKSKLPALVIFQWASPPYPLDKSWVTQHARGGWLVLNIEPHDVLPDQPKSYYDELPSELKNYHAIGSDDRDKSYFVEMYLRGVRAVDYIAAHPDWDGKTLVVMGTSMGGQQALAIAGLHDKVTHVIVNEPAGCDTNAPLHGRKQGYPNFPVENPKVAETARYVDVVNLASRITAKSLVAIGFVDTVCPPTGIYTAFNQIKGQKEVVPMIDSPHNHQATPLQQKPWSDRSSQWLRAIVNGQSAMYDDHANMMEQLGIRALRPGPDPNDAKTYDESLANSLMSSLPDALRMKDATRVTTAAQWPARRKEIVEDFEREVFGRIPANVPAVEWRVAQQTKGQTATGVSTITSDLIGRVDNSQYPQLSVEIEASFTVPENASRAVPMMLLFAPPRRAGAATRPSTSSSWTEIAIAHGWGYGRINPISIQPDNNQLTTAGIIALTNRGQPRTPEQWGALRAWQWGVSRLIDYFELHPEARVDPTKVGIEGVSRYGKAALVTQAFDPRVAVSLVASSGEGGAKLHRRLFGERVENLAGGSYYWMAGNFIKYGAADPEMTAADLPVDAHQLIALCAPRPCFVSYGTVEGGDPHWVDARGSFMAGVLASEVYELLGKRGFGRNPREILTEPMPSVNQLVGGELAWRQHDGGHDVTPNWPAFFEWVSAYVKAGRQ